MAMHQGRRSRLLTIRAVDWQEQATVSGIICTYILYFKGEQGMLVTPCSGLPITTTVADESLNSLIFHDDSKYVTDN